MNLRPLLLRFLYFSFFLFLFRLGPIGPVFAFQLLFVGTKVATPPDKIPPPMGRSDGFLSHDVWLHRPPPGPKRGKGPKNGKTENQETLHKSGLKFMFMGFW